MEIQVGETLKTHYAPGDKALGVTIIEVTEIETYGRKKEAYVFRCSCGEDFVKSRASMDYYHQKRVPMGCDGCRRAFNRKNSVSGRALVDPGSPYIFNSSPIIGQAREYIFGGSHDPGQRNDIREASAH